MNSPREQLDQELNYLLSKIYINTHQIKDKHIKIRVLQWLDKIKAPTQNTIWKQNSVLYAKVLFQMMPDSVEKPFRSIPPDGPLPRLDKFDVVLHILNKPSNIWKTLHERKPLRQNHGLINKQYTPKMKTEPIQFDLKSTSNFHSKENPSMQWDSIKTSIEGANKNMQEFKNYIDRVLKYK